jgi:hypothetical protein
MSHGTQEMNLPWSLMNSCFVSLLSSGSHLANCRLEQREEICMVHAFLLGHFRTVAKVKGDSLSFVS